MTETYKILFNYRRLKENNEQKFFVTYHAGYAKEFLEFISECVFEADEYTQFSDDANEFKPENIGKKIQDEVGDLIDGETYYIDTWHIYEESSCWSETYFDMKSYDLAVQYVIDRIKDQINETKKIWGDDVVFKLHDEIQKQIIEVFTNENQAS